MGFKSRSTCLRQARSGRLRGRRACWFSAFVVGDLLGVLYGAAVFNSAVISVALEVVPAGGLGKAGIALPGHDGETLRRYLHRRQPQQTDRRPANPPRLNVDRLAAKICTTAGKRPGEIRVGPRRVAIERHTHMPPIAAGCLSLDRRVTWTNGHKVRIERTTPGFSVRAGLHAGPIK